MSSNTTIAQKTKACKAVDDFLDKIICADCLKGMRKLPDNCIDLTVTSPPYDDLRKYNGFNHK